ncbi:hypothetical protein HK105_207530 [Polyrhizophydium stewartii]|uniref:Fanconi anemia group I protein n=1 Tax=Polyrhizophydium stewartii TaxID=2732419 RepID=A0ABR4N0F3_9FUNG
MASALAVSSASSAASDFAALLRPNVPVLRHALLVELVRAALPESNGACAPEPRDEEALIVMCSQAALKGACVQALSLVIPAIQSGKALQPRLLELVGRLLSALGQVGRLVIQDSTHSHGDESPTETEHLEQREITGAQCRSVAIGRILASQWDPQTSLHIIGILVELDLSDKEVRRLARRTINNPVLSQRIKGSILTNIAFAMRSDQALCTEFIKVLRDDYTQLFANLNFPIVLLVASLPRFESVALDLMTLSVRTWLEAYDRTRSIKWLFDNLQGHFSSLDSQLSAMMKEGAFGETGITEQIISSLLKLACYFIDGSLAPAKKKGDSAHSRRMDVAKGIFESLFKRPILESLFDRMLFKSDASLHAIAIFEALCKDPQAMAAHSAMIKDMINNVYAVPDDVSKRLLACLSPVIVRDPLLFDAVMLVLRKGSFQREKMAREVALDGLLALLDALGKAGSGPFSSDATKFEILGYLRRFMSQQHDVREHLYDRLVDLVSGNANINDTVLGILWAQLSQYLHARGEGLRLDMCVTQRRNGTEPQEPLGFLLHAFTIVMSKSERQPDNDQELAAMADCMLQAISTFSKLHHQDLPFGDERLDGTDQDASALESKQTRLALAQSIYEAMLGHCFVFGDGSQEWRDIAMALFKRLQDIKASLKEMQPKGRGPVREKRVGSALSLQVCAPIIDASFGDRASDPEMGFFILSAASGRIQSSRDSHLQLPKGFFEDTITICRVIFQTFLRQPTHEARYEKRLFVLGVECFERCFVVIRDRDERRLLEWLVCVLDFTDVDPRDLEQRSAEGREQYRSRLTASLKSLFGQTALVKQALALFRCIGSVVKLFACDEAVLKGWLLTDIFQQPIVDGSTAKEIFELFFQSVCVEQDAELLRKIAVSAAAQFGCIQDDDDDDRDNLSESDFAIVCPQTAPAVSLGMLGFLDASLEQLEWCFMHSHALIPSLAGTALSFESRLIDRLIVIIGMLSEFENACMPPSVSDALLRSIGKAYRLLTVVAKTKLKDNETSLSEAFIRLVEAASATMTPRLYSLIPYLQQRDGESVVNKKKNGRGKQHLSSDTKMIPQLIYQIEQFERHLIQVSKRCKRSTARDFRIHVQKIADESEEGSDGEGPEKKRARSEEGAAAD